MKFHWKTSVWILFVHYGTHAICKELSSKIKHNQLTRETWNHITNPDPPSPSISLKKENSIKSLWRQILLKWQRTALICRKRNEHIALRIRSNDASRCFKITGQDRCIRTQSRSFMRPLMRLDEKTKWVVVVSRRVLPSRGNLLFVGKFIARKHRTKRRNCEFYEDCSLPAASACDCTGWAKSHLLLK